MYVEERYFVKNIGKRRVNRGRDTHRDGKKTWYVSFQSQYGSFLLADTTLFGAIVWKLRKTFSRYRLNTDENSE